MKRLRPGRIRRRLPLKATCNRRLCLRVAIIGTSSGPNWAAICRERKPDPSPASNNFLDFEVVIHSGAVQFSQIGSEKEISDE